MLPGGGRLPRNTVLPSPALCPGPKALPALSCRIDFAFSVVIVIITHLNNFLGKKERNPVTIKHPPFILNSCPFLSICFYIAVNSGPLCFLGRLHLPRTSAGIDRALSPATVMASGHPLHRRTGVWSPFLHLLHVWQTPIALSSK